MTLSTALPQESPAPAKGIEGSRRPTRLPLPAALRIAVAALSLAASFALLKDLRGATPDDAFITFRYAQNLIDGHGWNYNLRGSTSDAATAPLYTLVLAGVGEIVGSVTRASSLLYVITSALSSYFAFELLYRRGMAIGGMAAAAFLVLNPWIAATRGMETSMFICMTLGAMLLLSRRNHLSAGVVLAAAVLVRGDAALIAAIAFAATWIGYRAFPWRLVAGAAATAIPWTIFAFIVIGSPIPDTLGAKAAQGESGYWGTGHLYLRGLYQIPQQFAFMSWWIGILVLALPGVFVLALKSGLRRDLAPFGLGALAIYLAYGLVIKTPVYHWYYGIQIAFISVCAGVFVGFVANAVARSVRIGSWDIDSDAGAAPASSGRANMVKSTLAAFVIAALAAGTNVTYGWRELLPGLQPTTYINMGTWIKDNTPPDSRIASTEIGLLGWFGDRDMIDYLGLLSKKSVSEVRRGDFTSWLTREEPDYWIVHQPAWSFEQAALQPWFALAYEPVFSQQGLVVWKHVRPISEAKALAASALSPPTADVLQLVGPAASAPGAANAVASLLAVYSMRPDLQHAFGPAPGLVDLAGLFSWASATGITSDSSSAALQAFGGNFGAMAQAVRAGPIPLTLPSLVTS
jgi:hypothetical protein